MFISTLKVKNFKILEDIELSLDKNINIFIGNNAQGKTSILECIYLLALTKSFKNIDDYDLIRKTCDFYRISALVNDGNYSKLLQVFYNNEGKSLKINGTCVNKYLEYVSLLNVIVFSPDDLDIVKKSPSYRRDLLNIELCQMFNKYMIILSEYNKILKIRNDYLKKGYKNIDKTYLDILTDKLIDRAIVIMDYRDRFLSSININIGTIFHKIMGVSGLSVAYNRSLNFSDKVDIVNFFDDNFFNEISKKMTLYGPHRDDFTFMINDTDLKLYGSQGQQRVAILSFKLAEINLFKEVKKTYPVVLLDDIFSELDISKRNNLLKFIRSNIQFIITTTDIKNISKGVIDKSKIFNIKNGKIKIQGVKNE